MRLNYNHKCKRRFLKKKSSHLNSQKIKDFYLQLNTKHSDKLYEIHYHSSFAFYLYLFLKNSAEGYNSKCPDEFTISKPVKINFTKVAKMAKVSRNTVKAAYAELLNLGLVYETIIPIFSNKVKECMVLNDCYLIGYDEEKHRIIYSIDNNT